ncbi:MAG: hypothetical protein KDC98_24440 [Planctomycetes bacterium]|nr:hypothetical protein [Planctomycetota bacterium]
MDLIALLEGVLPPILIALALVSIAGNRLLPMAMALGLGAAFVLLKSWPLLPHELWLKPKGLDWLLWGVIALALAASLEHWRCLPARSSSWLVAVIGAGVVWLMLDKLAGRESTGWAVAHVGGGGIGVMLLTFGGARVVARAESSPFLPLLFTAVLSIDAVLLTLGRSALYGQLCGACAAAVGAAIGTALWRRPFTMAGPDAALCGAVHGLFLLAGVHLAYLTWPVALLAAVMPVLPLVLPKSFAKERPKRWMLVALVLVALPAGVAIAIS